MKKVNVGPITMIAIVAIVIAVIILAPLAIIWALNTLFALSIAYNFWTWLAILVLTSTFGRANVRINKDN